VKPLVQYATTADGVSIAFAVAGEGTPVIVAADPPCSHVQLEWEQPPNSLFNERLSARRMLVRFDSRGLGLSDREMEDLSLEGRVLDVEAVADRVEARRFVLCGVQNSAAVAITYAVRHAERVSHLILIDAIVRGADFFVRTPQMGAMVELLARDWEMFTENLGALAFGWGRDETRRYGEFVRACVTRETLTKLYAAMATVDVMDLLPRVSAPTLLIHHSGITPSSAERAKVLASTIPHARLTFVEGGWLDGWDDAMRAIDEFLGDVAPADKAREGATGSRSGTAVILFADIAGSTALTERLGDAAFREKARELDEALRRAISGNGGTAIEGKLLGDGVLATFGAAREAIACAGVIHQAGSHAGLPLHVGIHAGDVIREEGNVYGGAVNIASRVAGEAAAGETLVSATVRDLARTSAGVAFEDRGERALKGVSEPVRVYAVRET
jgi:class 3 adenylate cyclase